VPARHRKVHKSPLPQELAFHAADYGGETHISPIRIASVADSALFIFAASIGGKRSSIITANYNFCALSAHVLNIICRAVCALALGFPFCSAVSTRAPLLSLPLLNANSSAATGVALTDTLSVGIVVAAPLAIARNTRGFSTASVGAGSEWIPIAANKSCTQFVDVGPRNPDALAIGNQRHFAAGAVTTAGGATSPAECKPVRTPLKGSA